MLYSPQEGLHMVDEADMKVVKTLASKVHTESVIWIVISVFQILSIVGALVGIYNLIISIMNLDSSKKMLAYPVGIVRSFEPLTGSIVVLCINLFFGAFIGIIGSLYHIFGVRGYVMEHRDAFLRVEAALTNPSSAN